MTGETESDEGTAGAASGDDEVEREIDRLHETPPGRFIEARNALAARLKTGGRRQAAARVKALARPGAAAWAVNQVYWRARDFYERVVEAGEALRAAQESGTPDALRAAMAARREALAAALERGLGALRRSGHAVTPAVEQRVSNTLLALATHGRRPPAEVVPGRLAHDLEPPGFEALAGLPLPPLRAEPAPSAAEQVTESVSAALPHEAAPGAPRAAEGETRTPTVGGDGLAPPAVRGAPAPQPAEEHARAVAAAGHARLEALAAEADRARAARDTACRAAGAAQAAAGAAREQVDALRRELSRAEDRLRAAEQAAALADERLREAEAGLSSLEQARTSLGEPGDQG